MLLHEDVGTVGTEWEQMWEHLKPLYSNSFKRLKIPVPTFPPHTPLLREIKKHALFPD